MTYSMGYFDGIQESLSSANSTVMLCRANLGQVELSEEDRANLIWRIERQRAELEAMFHELRLSTQYRQIQRSR